jgi:hypothetical protein
LGDRKAVKIRGGHTIQVYRPTGKDRFGDGDLNLIGSIENVIVQWASANPIDRAEEVESMSTVIYCPRDAAIQLRERDRFKLNNEWWSVIGDPAWDENHPVTGHNFGYYMMHVQMRA